MTTKARRVATDKQIADASEDGGFVWMEHPDIGAPARVPAEGVRHYEQSGWRLAGEAGSLRDELDGQGETPAQTKPAT
jgi:hypothetical protein